MLFRKRSRQSGQPQQEKSLYPVLHVAGSLKEYQQELVKKEVSSLWELSQVGTSFGGVMKEGDQFQAKLQELDQSFANINGTAEQFNILAINASIEAARAGAEGRSFSVVATQVKQLAEEIKALTGEVDGGVNEVETRANELSQSITTSQQTLGQSLDIVAQTEGSFEKIITVAEGATSVQTGISGVIDVSRQELQSLRQFFDKIKERYQEVVAHIESASQLGTTKSAMFEDMDNMISQIPPLVNEMESNA